MLKDRGSFDSLDSDELFIFMKLGYSYDNNGNEFKINRQIEAENFTAQWNKRL